MAQLTYDEVRTFIADSEENNHLLDGVEFTDTRISLAMEMSVDSYNILPPVLNNAEVTDILSDPGGLVIGKSSDGVRSKAVLLYGTLWHLFTGQMALAARNQMSYSDGGLTIPIEERYQFYVQMASMFENSFKTSAKEDKVAINLEGGWGMIHSDYATFPVW